MLKWLLIAFGGVSLLGGALTLLLPLPLGVPLILLGTALLIRHSPRTRERVAHLVQRYPRALGFLAPLLRPPP